MKPNIILEFWPRVATPGMTMTWTKKPFEKWFLSCSTSGNRYSTHTQLCFKSFSFFLSFFFAKLLTDLILVMEPTIIFWENKRVIKKVTHLFQVSVWTLVTTKWWCFSKEFYFSCMIYFFLLPNCQKMFSHNE